MATLESRWTAARRSWLARLRWRVFGDARLEFALLLIVGSLLGVAGGFAVASQPLPVVGGLVAVLAAGVLVERPRLGLYAAVLVITLLPFGVIPLPLGGFQFTFLDAALTATLGLWLASALLGPDQRVVMSSVGLSLLVFVGWTAVAFVNGSAYGIPPENARLYLKGINSLLVFFTLLNLVRTRSDARLLLAVALAGGAVAGAMGIILYVLPHDLTISLLSKLGRLGYPTGPGVLRFIADSDRLRAVGTSIDPNVFGATLMMIGVLAATQLPAGRPLIARQYLAAALLPIGLALLLTLSRSSWMGFAAGCLFAATVRYRRLWLLAIPAGPALALGLLPGLDQYVGHLLTGFRAEDRATLMRLGEYKDALELISRYPWLGVGYGNAPSPDLYVGVSSAHLLLAENAGLVGLAIYWATMALLFKYVLVGLARAQDNGLSALALSGASAVFAALVAGVFDQHFVNIRFPHVVALLWICAGLAVAARRMATSPEETHRDEVGR